MIFSLTKYSIAFTNSVSDITSSAHQPAVFFTQSGTFSANAFGIKTIPDKIIMVHTRVIAIFIFNLVQSPKLLKSVKPRDFQFLINPVLQSRKFFV